jgi:acetyl esterase/lipase
MPIRIGLMTAACSLAGIGPAPSADGPPAREEIVVLRDLRYRDGPGPRWRLDLAMKQGRRGRRRPAVVVIHGGGWLEGDKSSFSAPDSDAPGHIREFAALGFVAAAVNYRLSGEAPYPAALEDCRCAVRWLRAHAEEYGIDEGRIGAYGNSAGGHLALLLGLTEREEGPAGDGPHRGHSGRVQAVASDSGPVDLLAQYRRDRLRGAVARFMGGPPEGRRLAAYERASPIHRITPEAPPLLLIYGAADAQVPVETADRFVVALGRAGLEDVSYHRLARVGHCPHSLARVPGLRPVVAEFFTRTLGPAEAAPPVERPSGTR